MALLPAVILCIACGIVYIRYPFQLDYGEGPILYQAQRITEGISIYQPDLSDYPFVVANYPPVYVFLLSSLSRVFGLSLAMARSLSFVSSLVCALAIGGLVHSLTHRMQAGVGAALLFVGHPFVGFWSPLARVDLLALMFCSLGLYSAVRLRNPRWGPVLSAVLMTAAIFTRQSYALAGPLAVLVHYALRSRREAATFLLSFSAVTLALGLALFWRTAGGAYMHLIVANANRLRLEQLLAYGVHALVTSVPLLVIAIPEARRVIADREGDLALPVAFALGGALASLTVAKIGSNVNYFLELVAGVSILAGIAIARMRVSPKSWTLVLLLGIVVAQGAINTHSALPRLRSALSMEPNSADLQKMAQVLRDEEGPVLADEHTALLVETGHKLLLQPFEMTQLAEEGKWDDRAVVQDLREGTFALVVRCDAAPRCVPFVTERWTSGMRSALAEAYEPVAVLAGNTLYRPILDAR